MAKLALLLATFTLLFLIASASIYRTTVEVDEENPRGQSCQEQFQQQQQLRHCQMFLRQQSQGGAWDNQQQHLRECCRQLQQLETRCRCPGLEQAVRRQQQQGPFGEQQEMFETASEIPRMCQMQPLRGCDFRSLYTSFWSRLIIRWSCDGQRVEMMKRCIESYV